MTSLKSGVKLELMKKLSLYIFLGLMVCNVVNAASPTGLYKLYASAKLFILGGKCFGENYSFFWDCRNLIIIVVILIIIGAILVWDESQPSKDDNK